MTAILICIVAGVLNALMDDTRDNYPNDLMSKLPFKWTKRHTSDRHKIPIYGANFFTDRLIEYFNDTWHANKFVLFVMLIVVLPVHADATFVMRLVHLIVFALSFEVVYHRRWKLFTRT